MNCSERAWYSNGIAGRGGGTSVGVGVDCAAGERRSAGCDRREVAVVGVVEEVEGFDRDDGVVALVDLEGLLQAGVDAVDRACRGSASRWMIQ